MIIAQVFALLALLLGIGSLILPAAQATHVALLAILLVLLGSFNLLDRIAKKTP